MTRFDVFIVEPRLAGQSHTVEAYEGQSVTLHCGLVGLPGGSSSSVGNTSVRWASGGGGKQLIPMSGNSFIKYSGADLLFVTTRKADSGNYTCQPDDSARKLITGAVTYRLKVKGTNRTYFHSFCTHFQTWAPSFKEDLFIG